MILANTNYVDPVWLFLTIVIAPVFLFFAFRALSRERRRMQLRVSEQVDRLARIEQKLDRPPITSPRA